MVSAIVENQEKLHALCERFGVARLEVFGSAAEEVEFDPNRSDIDIIVTFRPDQEMGPWLQTYFDFRKSLADLFGYPVDLVISSAIKNRHFIREANRTRKLIYGI